MNKLGIPPDNVNYSVGDGDDRLSINYGVSSKFRRKFFNTFKLVQISWAVSQAEYKALRTFYTNYVASGGVSFLMDLYLDDIIISEYQCEFSSFSLESVQGNLFNVSAVLRVRPTAYNVSVGSWVTDAGLNLLSIQPTFGNFVLSGNSAYLHNKITKASVDTSYYLLIGQSLQLIRYGRRSLLPGYFSLSSPTLTLTKNSVISSSDSYELREDGTNELREDGSIELRETDLDYELREDGGNELREDGTFELREVFSNYELREDGDYELREDSSQEIREG